VILTEIRDLTERKRMEERLKRSETKYRHLFENMINGYAYMRLLIDANDNAVDAIFLEINPAFEKITALERDRIVGKKYSELFTMTVHDKKLFSNVFSVVALKGGVKNIESYWATLGKWLRLQVYTSERGYCSVLAEDITRQREEREKREVEQKRAMEEVSALLYSSRNIQRNSSFKESAKAIYESCKVLLGAKTGHVSILTSDNRVEMSLNEAGLVPDNVGLPLPSKMIDEVIKGGLTIFDNFPENLAKATPPPPAKRKNVLISPLKYDGKTIGLLLLADKVSDFDERDKRLASAFAELISIALVNERYQESLKKMRSEHNVITKEYKLNVENFNGLFNAMPRAMIVGQRTKIVFANTVAGAILGIKPKNLQGRGLSEFRLAGQSHTIKTANTDQKDDPLVGGNVELIKADGTRVGVTLSIGKTTWNSKPATIYIFSV
jgi:PAS domain S-box-containing protein